MSKQMMSRFKSKCRECDAPIAAGDPITWHGKGAGVSCSACEPVDLRAFYTPGGVTQPDAPQAPQAPQAQPNAPAFDPALSWDDAPPAPGKSIGDSGIKTADALAALDKVRAAHGIDVEACAKARDAADAATTAPNGATMTPVQSDERDAIAADAAAYNAAQQKRNADASRKAAHDSTRAVVELAAQRVKRDAERESAPALDPLAATVCDLLVTLVNCIDRLDSDQCDALRTHANRYSADSASGSRRRLWQSLGRAIG